MEILRFAQNDTEVRCYFVGSSDFSAAGSSTLAPFRPGIFQVFPGKALYAPGVCLYLFF
ncbi:MAG TPA: hypothetical protein ACFYD3_08005 [Candidatus Hypogeohydataceae bacterium YC41]